MELQTQSVALSKDPETEGFDLQAGETWIYPTNYPTRDYQYNIIQEALLKNTLVSLPTGLGKTFIAAVVMYNFYRWYPHGKIIFMAPTKPLVKQQIEACYNIMAIPHQATAVLTGTKVSSYRSDIWKDKRVFFVTPQVLQNDLEKVAELGPKIKCLVFDEAHKAKGNHAYCQVIRKLFGNDHKYFRVLALSATPGCNVNEVEEVVHNLLISHLEFRTEESTDVQPYVFQRNLETVVVQLDRKLMEVKNEYLQILEYYTKTLIKFKIIQGNCASLTKGKIYMIMKDFQNKNRGTSSSNYSEIMRCLNICVTLYHAFELLIRHGLRSFLSFFDEHIEKPLLRGNSHLRSILEKVRGYLGPIPAIEVLPDGTYPEIPKHIKFGHPKYYKLRDILLTHFSGGDKNNTRVIVFFEYRESVMEAHTLLLQSRPLILPKIFLGQGSGVTQKTQLGVVKAFREGKCNTLLSTCIGEEGLDVGEVDLIVCFDISNKSPIRMVQRMGRTGRKRAGSVLVLVTEGKEQQTLKDCLIHKNNISTYVLGSTHLNNSLYPHNPRLVPPQLTPRCEKMFITVMEKAKKSSILEKLQKCSSKIAFTQHNDALEYTDLIPEIQMKSFSANPMARSNDLGLFSGHIEKMRTARKVCSIGHSDHTTILGELLRYADSKRFNIPVNDQGTTNAFSGKSFKQGDIRNMFFKDNGGASTEDDGVTQLTQKPSQNLNNPINDQAKTSTLPSEELFRILSNHLVTDLADELLKCSLCNPGFRCEAFALDYQQLDSFNNNSQILIPSEETVNSIGLEDIENFISSLDGSFKPKHTEQSPQFETECSLKANENTFSFEAPSTYLKMLDNLNISDFITQRVEEKSIISSERGLLDFFKVESFCDIYGSPNNSSQDTIIYSPDVNLDKNDSPEKPQTPNEALSKKNISLEDLCDLSYFGLTDFDKPCASPAPADEEVQPNKTSTGTSGNLQRDESTSKRLNESRVSITQMIDMLNHKPFKGRQNETVGKQDISKEFSEEVILFSGEGTSDRDLALKESNIQNTSFRRPFPTSSKDFTRNRCRNVKKLTSKSRKKYNEFLDLEAEVSEDENAGSSEDEDTQAMDHYEKSFVNDLTQNFNTEMHGVYLRSIRSPNTRSIVKRKRPILAIENVYSQPPPIEMSEYLEDSFCVESSDEDHQSELSELDILEKQLEKRKKRKKATLANSEAPKRRKRIKSFSSDDSE